MPRGAGKGGKTRKKTKNQDFGMRRLLTLKEEDQEYGQVTKMLGSSRVECMCSDQKKRVCLIRGKMKNRVWIRQGDLLLISIRDFEPDKGDVFLKYTNDEYRDLEKMGAIPEAMEMIDEVKGESDDEIEFTEIVPKEKKKHQILEASDEEEEKKDLDDDDIDNI